VHLVLEADRFLADRDDRAPDLAAHALWYQLNNAI
jgi:hypothetical protein